MLKQTIKYEDYDDNVVTEDLYFNITRIELAENLDIRDELEDVERKFRGSPRELSPAEVKLILDVVKRLIKIAYGVRSEDGKRFIKTDEVWNNFIQSAAYDAFLMDLFESPDRANDFMVGLVPKQMREQVAALKTEDTPDISAVPDEQSPEIFQGYDIQELMKKDAKDLSREQMLAVLQYKQSQ